MGSTMKISSQHRTANALLKIVLAAALALTGCTLTALVNPASNTAFAVPASTSPVRADTAPVINELQQRVEDTAAAYNESLVRLTDVEQQIENNQTQIKDITAQLETQREKSSQAAAEFYRMQRSGSTLLELLFSAQTITDLTVRVEYVLRLQDSYFNEITRLNNLCVQLDEARHSLEANRATAQAEAIRAEEALADAKAAREEARLQAEAEAAAQALAASMPVALPPETPPEKKDLPETPSPIDSLSDREAFITHWAQRIDAYLGSSPLGGYGKNFAAAAWDYGVDPRVAPAISCNESGKGSVCFLPHNAWGWGNYSWPDWPTAIEQYTAGFSRGYGYVITLEGAKRYAPLCWEVWYPIIIGEMNRI